MAAIYPRLVRNHRWWQAARDPERRGLVATLHPWETGMDNSPAWDTALARVPTETKTVDPPARHQRTSIATMRPRGEEYQRFIHLVDLFRDAGLGADRMLAASPFRVADIGTNAILLRAEQDLLALAARFGDGRRTGGDRRRGSRGCMPRWSGCGATSSGCIRRWT